jgi:hypothetical protein
VAVTGPERDDDARRASSEVPSEVPWHNRTSTLLGASVVGLAVIALLIAGGLWLSRQFNEPEPAPLNFVDPSFSATQTETTAPTTTGTITSTSPPMTTDINPESTPETTTDSSTSRTSRPPRSQEDDGDDDEVTTTTRKRPRTNVTRTLYPGT